jgi:hypothetical protein
MNDTAEPQPETTREVVGILGDRAQFEKAVEALLDAGFARTDISVLASHESLDASVPAAAGAEHGLVEAVGDTLRAMVGELKFAGPLGAAGIAILFGGPAVAAAGAVIAAGVGGLALKEVLSEALGQPHAEHFERAVEAGGIILWVYVESAAREQEAKAILAANGGSNIHIQPRRSPAAPDG